MANKVNKDDPRTFLYLSGLKVKLVNYAHSDPRFESVSACAKHLISIGMVADKQDREKALKSVS